ncbi:MAG: hypothetical protein WKG32_07125 [Gemmatimonadaceae bacterium]
MPIVSLYGHHLLRRRLADAIVRDALPPSLLIHGPRGIGKQRFALWLGQRLLCSGAGERPCGVCTSCRYAVALTHPDLRWFFPRPRLGDADATAQDIRDDYADAIAERAAASGLYAPASGTEAIYVATVRTVVQMSAYTPSVAKRKVFVLGDAERMVPQEGADAAANAFLKLLEEPPVDTTLILTSSEPGALLPTIRSRVAAFRASPLPEADVRAFLADPAVGIALGAASPATSTDERLRLAAGAPGALLGAAGRGDALGAARELLEAAGAGPAEWSRSAFKLGGTKARGFFADVLDALTVLLHQRLREAVTRSDTAGANWSARAIDAVERAKARAAGNVSPQLLAASLARALGDSPG